MNICSDSFSQKRLLPFIRSLKHFCPSFFFRHSFFTAFLHTSKGWLVDNPGAKKKGKGFRKPMSRKAEQSNPEVDLGQYLDLTTYYSDKQNDNAIWLLYKDDKPMHNTAIFRQLVMMDPLQS